MQSMIDRGFQLNSGILGKDNYPLHYEIAIHLTGCTFEQFKTNYFWRINIIWTGMFVCFFFLRYRFQWGNLEIVDKKWSRFGGCQLSRSNAIVMKNNFNRNEIKWLDQFFFLKKKIPDMKRSMSVCKSSYKFKYGRLGQFSPVWSVITLCQFC